MNLPTRLLIGIPAAIVLSLTLAIIATIATTSCPEGQDNP